MRRLTAGAERSTRCGDVASGRRASSRSSSRISGSTSSSSSGVGHARIVTQTLIVTFEIIASVRDTAADVARRAEAFNSRQVMPEPRRDSRPASCPPTSLDVLEAVQRRVLWLAT